MSTRTPTKRQYDEASSSAPVKESDHVRDDAYKISIEATNNKEVNYPYMHISYFFLNTVDRKHEGLKPHEIANFYTEHHSTAPYLPKAFDYYQAILAEIGSVVFSPIERSTHEWAFIYY